MKPRVQIAMISLIAILVSLTACNNITALINGEPDTVQTRIISTDYADGVSINQEVTFTTRSTHPQGIKEVRFTVDENVDFEQVKSPQFPQVEYIIPFTWIPRLEKKYLVKVVAIGIDDTTDIYTATVEAKFRAASAPTSVQASPTRAATAPPVSTARLACLNQATLVTEFTNPAGTQLNPGQIFQKTWRIRNNGTCEWNAGYYFDNVNGVALGGSRVTLAPFRLGEEREITVSMQAPTRGGTHRGEWQVHDDQGRAFERVFVVEIVVPQACDQPRITSFSAVPSTITSGQNSTLQWTVEGATSLTLNPGNTQLSPGDGSAPVAPVNTTTYILEARAADNCSDSRQLTVTVIRTPNAPSNLEDVSAAQTEITLKWNDNSNNEDGFRIFNVDTNQTYDFPANITQGTITGLTCGTLYRWQIRAFNNDGESEPSNIRTVPTTGC